MMQKILHLKVLKRPLFNFNFAFLPVKMPHSSIFNSDKAPEPVGAYPHARKVVDIQFALIRKRLAQNGITITADPEVLDKLSALGYGPQFGARPLKRVLQREVLNALSKQILEGTIEQGGVVNLTLDDAENIAFESVKKTII